MRAASAPRRSSAPCRRRAAATRRGRPGTGSPPPRRRSRALSARPSSPAIHAAARRASRQGAARADHTRG
eukprot:7383334-Prymnesium_polylepis.1